MNPQQMVTVDAYYPPVQCVSVLDQTRCTGRCIDPKCLYVCPAGMFREINGEVILDSEGVCLECGACRLVCDNIVFDYPPAGRGIIHKFG